MKLEATMNCSNLMISDSQKKNRLNPLIQGKGKGFSQTQTKFYKNFS